MIHRALDAGSLIDAAAHSAHTPTITRSMTCPPVSTRHPLEVTVNVADDMWDFGTPASAQHCAAALAVATRRTKRYKKLYNKFD